MASGINDSAAVLYYSNVNYNSSTIPKSSYVISNLNSRFLNDQSNYEIAINKLKVSSLEGVRMGYIPYNQWQVQLTVPNGAGVAESASEYVNLPGMVPSSSYYQYFTTIDANFSIVLNKGANGTLGQQLFSFTPLDNSSNPITPIFSVYDSINSIYWVATNYSINVYNATGNLLEYTFINDIRTVSYSVNAKALLVVQNNNTSQNVLCYKWVSNVISLFLTYSNDKFGTPLTDIRCSATDGQTMIIIWREVALNTYYATTYNFLTQIALNQGALPTATISNPISVIVNTADNSFIVCNDSYDELIQLGANTQSPFVSGSNTAEIVNVGLSQTMIPIVGLINPLDAVFGFQSFDNASGGTVFAVCKDALGNYTSKYQTNTLWDDINALNWAPSVVASSFIPFSIAYYKTPDNMPLLVGLYQSSPTTFDIVSIGANGQWLPVFQNITGIDTTAQIVVDIGGAIWMTHAGNLYRFSTIPTYTPGSAPYLNIASGGFNIVNQIGSAYTISSIVWDNLIPNIAYGLISANNSIYRIIYNSDANTIQLCEWYKDANSYNGYLSKSFAYANQTNNTNIYKFNITSFSSVGSPISISNNYAPNMTISRQVDIIYIPNTVIGTSSVVAYDYLTFNPIGTITGYNPVQPIGVYTSYETTPPSLSVSAYYDLQTVIDIVNSAYLACYNQLKNSISPMPVSGPPVLTLNYETHKLTMTYDTNYLNANTAISVNSALLRYILFSNVANGNWYNYVLNASGSMGQSKETVYLLNHCDKLIIKTNMSLLTDYTGADTNTTIFTDLDIDTQNQFFNMSGDFIYSAILLRNYCMLSNQQLRSISYQLFISYLDGSEAELLIPPAQNASIKFQFTRIY